MNRQMMRASKKIGRAMMKLNDNPFEDVTAEALRKTQLELRRYPDRIWKNNHYIVQLYRRERIINGVLMDKYMFRRNDEEPIRDWYTLQNLKNRIIGDEVAAIQVFPKQSELVDVANLYWLFVPSDQVIL